MSRNRGGFTLIELLISMTIIGILASVAIPKFRDVKRRALATQVVGDFDVVRAAVLGFYTDSGYFPKESGTGEMPKNLNRYLPMQFAFKQTQWSLDYEYVKTGGKGVKASEIVGVSVKTQDAQVGRAAINMLSGATTMISGKYTFIISGM